MGKFQKCQSELFVEFMSYDLMSDTKTDQRKYSLKRDFTGLTTQQSELPAEDRGKQVLME